MKTKNRLELPDILRGLAVLFMIEIHALNLYGNQQASQGIKHAIADFMGGPPAAPVFMAVMGFFFLLKKPPLKTAVWRGIKLILLGYGLNFVRGYLPISLARVFLRWDASMFPQMFTNYYLIWSVDILIFAGLAYIAIALLAQISEHPLFLGVAAALLGFVSPFLWGIGENLPFIHHILNPIWGADMDLVTFPFFPWIVYPIFGMLTAAVYRMKLEHKTLTRWSLIAGTLLLICGGTLMALDFDRFYHDYGQQGWGALLAFPGFVLLWGLLVRFINQHYPQAWKTGFLKFLGRNVTTIYVFQWLIIGWGYLIYPLHPLSFERAMGVAVIVTVLSCFGTLLYQRLPRYKPIKTRQVNEVNYRSGGV